MYDKNRPEEEQLEEKEREELEKRVEVSSFNLLPPNSGNHSVGNLRATSCRYVVSVFS